MKGAVSRSKYMALRASPSHRPRLYCVPATRSGCWAKAKHIIKTGDRPRKSAAYALSDNGPSYRAGSIDQFIGSDTIRRKSQHRRAIAVLF
jgi:hypothetical protein